MARPLRIEFVGALYYVTSRGDRREGIYLDNEDRQRFLEVLEAVCERFNWEVQGDSGTEGELPAGAVLIHCGGDLTYKRPIKERLI